MREYVEKMGRRCWNKKNECKMGQKVSSKRKKHDKINCYLIFQWQNKNYTRWLIACACGRQKIQQFAEPLCFLLFLCLCRSQIY